MPYRLLSPKAGSLRRIFSLTNLSATSIVMGEIGPRTTIDRLPEHQLNDPDVDTVGQESTGPFVPKVMPAEIDPLELLTVPLRHLAHNLRIRGRCSAVLSAVWLYGRKREFRSVRARTGVHVEGLGSWRVRNRIELANAAAADEAAVTH
jgi:hypothetical protein